MGVLREIAEKNGEENSQQRRVILLLLLVPYLLVELAFNHRLLTLTSGIVDAAGLRGIETWGRIISGIGFGLLLWAFVLGRRMRALTGLLLSLLLGVALMWQLQKAAIDFWVRQAPPEDKRMSLALALLAQPASLGLLQTEKGSLLQRPAPIALQLTVASLFPASALHAARRDDLVQSWAKQVGSPYTAADLASVSPELADNAFRNLIVPPLALGLSLLVAMLNLAQLAAALVRVLARAAGCDRVWLNLTQPILALVLITASTVAGNSYVQSESYRQLLRPGLWEQSPLLATLTSWVLHAEPQWHRAAQWAHQVALRGATFGQPWPLDN